MSNDLIMFARAYNHLRFLARISYGTDDDFIRDVLPGCLQSNIISEFAATDPIWQTPQITIEDAQSVEFINPYKELYYNDSDIPETPVIPKTYWKYDMKRIILPDGWKLVEGCGCGHNFVPGCFALINNLNETVKILNFFPYSANNIK